MKTVYSVLIYEEGLRTEAFDEVSTVEELFELLSRRDRFARHPLSIDLRRHEIELDCEICSQGSVVEDIRLEGLQVNRRVNKND